MEATKLLAIYGAVVSTFAIAWNIRRDIIDRAHLTVCARLGYIVKSGGGVTIADHEFMTEKWPAITAATSPKLFITITNTGRRPAIVQGWAMRTCKKITGFENFIYPFTVLPKALKEGEYATEQTDDLSLLADGAKGIYAWDSRNKYWRLPRRDMRRLQREVKGCQESLLSSRSPSLH